MKKCLTSLLAVFVFGSVIAEDSAEKKEEFKPSGKAFGQIHANYHQLYEGDNHTANGMDLSRAYFGYGYSLSEQWSAKVKIDVSSYDKDDEYSKYRETFLKEASITYKKGNLKVSGGLVGLIQHKTQEKYWGHRYVYKSFQDAQKMSHSADIGLVLTYKLHDMISADLTLRNGEGYKKTQHDMTSKQMLGLTITPMDMLVIRGFASFGADTVLREVDGMDNAEIIYGGFAGLKPVDGLTVGAEYATQLNAGNVEDNVTGGVSAFASYDITEKVEVFVRFDNAAWTVMKEVEDEDGNPVLDANGNPSMKEDDSKSNSLFILGVQYQPFKKVKFACDYQWSKKINADDAVNGIYVHADIKF